MAKEQKIEVRCATSSYLLCIPAPGHKTRTIIVHTLSNASVNYDTFDRDGLGFLEWQESYSNSRKLSIRFVMNSELDL